MAKRALEITREEYTRLPPSSKRSLIPVNYKHVVTAFEELYNTKQSHLLKSLRRYEVLVLMAIHLEFLISKAEKVLLDRVQDRCDNMLAQLNWFGSSSTGSVSHSKKQIPSNTFREIVKRLQSFGLLNISVESGKIAENVHVQLFVY